MCAFPRDFVVETINGQPSYDVPTTALRSRARRLSWFLTGRLVTRKMVAGLLCERNVNLEYFLNTFFQLHLL